MLNFINGNVFRDLIFRLFTAPSFHSGLRFRVTCTVILRSPSLVILKEPPLLDFAPPKGAYFWLQSLLSAACRGSRDFRRHGARKQCGQLKNLVKNNLNEGSLCSLRINSVTKNLLLEKPVRNHIYEYIY
jgi:hypothetical protein